MDYKDLIATNISKITGLDKDKVYSLIEIPPQLDMGDYAFPCFTLAKELRKAPPMIAADIASDPSLTTGALTVKNVGPYVNFYVDREVLAQEVITEIISAGDN